MATKTNEKKEQSNLISLLELIAIIIGIVIVLICFPHTVVWNIIVLLLMLSFLIFVHEFGHFIIAKKCGVHVYEFALGMGPKIISFKRKNDPTIYSLRCLPIGGYNQMAGEDQEDDEELSKDKFMCNKTKLQRLAILVAGVCMNFITAIVLLFISGLIFGSKDNSTVIGKVIEDSPASKVGLVVGDKITKINGHKVSSWDTLNLYTVVKNKNKYNTYVVEHKNGTTDTYKITPSEYIEVPEKEIKFTSDKELIEILDKYNLYAEGVSIKDNQIYINSDAFIKVKDDLATVLVDNNLLAKDVVIGNGVITAKKRSIEVTKEFDLKTIKKVYELDEKATANKVIGISGNSKVYKGFLPSLGYAFKKFGSMITTMLLTVFYLITGKISVNALSGPVGIYGVVGTAATTGAQALIYLTAYLSVNLGVINILPFPAFDGGRVLFVGIEAITRKKVSPKVESMFHTIGFFLIMALMLYITVHDIMNII